MKPSVTRKSWFYTGLAAVVGFALAAALRPGDAPVDDQRRVTAARTDDSGSPPPAAADTSGQAGEIAVDTLRRRLDDEIRARHELERRLDSLERRLAELKQEATQANSSLPPADEPGDDAGDRAEDRAWFDEQALIDTGMHEARARELRLLFEQLELERLRLRDRATREGWDSARTREEFAALGDREASLRERLGEDEFAAYLYAAGRSNRVAVTSVLASAPAGQAGIRAGDQILRYAGERIFNPGELRSATSAGDLAELIEVEVDRDGETLRFYLSRGPLGVRTDSLSVAP